MRGVDDALQIGLRRLQRQAAQGVVGAQFQDHDVRCVFFQRAWETRRAAAGGFAADAGVDHAPARMGFTQTLTEQRDPALFR